MSNFHAKFTQKMNLKFCKVFLICKSGEIQSSFYFGKGLNNLSFNCILAAMSARLKKRNKEIFQISQHMYTRLQLLAQRRKKATPKVPADTLAVYKILKISKIIKIVYPKNHIRILLQITQHMYTKMQLCSPAINPTKFQTSCYLFVTICVKAFAFYRPYFFQQLATAFLKAFYQV